MNYDVSFSSSTELVTFMNCMVSQAPRSIFLVNEGFHQHTREQENLGEYYNLADFVLRLFRRRFSDLDLEGKVFFYACKCLSVNPDLEFNDLIEAIYEGIATGYFTELQDQHYQSPHHMLMDLLDVEGQSEFGTVVGHIEENVAMIGLVDRRVFEMLMVTGGPTSISC